MSSYSYSFLTSPKRYGQASFIDPLIYHFRLMNYRYEVTFSAYVLNPGEKLVMNSIVLLFLSLIGYALFSHLLVLILQSFRKIILSWAVSNDQIKVTTGDLSTVVVGSTSSAWDMVADMG
ncbi:hypothetical protein OCU04_003048 [Sclerotinia nivalis]|uniref:Uncharacterized protein n=1 Tax=Sclerotinia nivalis TaxID=352851 RepID=A0A9X0DN58_9HELO|nr:hypothetical protein OCU04_003048 [Sclerotinia nivalis]